MPAATASTPAPSKPSKNRSPLATGTVVGERYRVVSLLGEGATGTVYAAEHVSLQKRIALKILHSELTDTPEGVARFEREAMATSRIEHPNVAMAVDFGKLPDGSMYLALEYVEGVSLRSEIAKGPLGVQRSLYIGRQIASAIAAAQSHGIVHRDMKPENVMLLTKGSDTDFVKVLDFGIARVPVEEGSIGGPQALTKAGAVFGTAEYMPPEQGIGQKVDSRADLYALGVMLFEMIAGVRPYGAREDLGILAQQITLPVPTFAERAPGIEAPASLQRLVNRLLAKRPQERFPLAEDVVRALDAIIVGDASGSSAPAEPATADEQLPAFSLQTQLPGTLTAPAEGLAEPAQQPDVRVNSGQSETQAPAPTPSSKPPSMPKAAAVVLATSNRLQKWLDRATSLVDEKRNALPEPVRKWLIRVPAKALVYALVGALLLVVLGLGLAVHRSRVTSAAAAAASASALAAAQAEAASASASAAANRPPPVIDGDTSASAGESDSKDPNVMLEQAQKKLREGKDGEAVNMVAHVLGKHPDRRNDPRVASILFKAASSNAKGVVNTTFSLLQGTMAAPGAEIVYQIAADKSLPGYVRVRAEKWLHTPQFDRAASDALRIAARLRFAPNCESKHALLSTAAKAGGAAALAYLHELQGESGCGLSGKNDCYSCLRGDNELNDAIKAIETRMKE